MSDRDALLAAIVAEPLEETRWLVLADWLEEFDDPRRAELLRLHRKLIATCCDPDAHPERAAWQARMVELLIAGVRPCVPQETLILSGGVPMTFSFIPPGAFLMGSEKGEEEEKPVHRVEVPHGFFMGIYPVTQTQWLAVMGTDPSIFKGAERPVEFVSWDACQEFCTKLGGLTGRRVELPSEADWEYACRAGTTTEYFFGDVISTNIANYDGGNTASPSSDGGNRQETTPVGSFLPNAWGLFDVHGNIREWCSTLYQPYSTGAEPTPGPTGDRRVVRGGSWYNYPEFCRAAYRWWDTPDARYEFFGFRVCLRLA